jgi:methionine-rich copper-binding protein CopC
VALGTNVTATFSENVQDVSGTTFTLQQGTTTIAAVVTYDAATKTATLNPTADLALNTQYTATLTNGIRDAASNALTTSSWSFTTVSDSTPPTVTARSPGVNATAVAVGTNVTATFSEAVTGVSDTSFTLTDPAGAAVAAVVTYDAATRVATLNPNANLLADTKYTATLTGDIRDAAGNALTSTSWTFTTGPRPTVTTRTPAANATGVSRTANVTATFSEAVTGVSGTTFTLKTPANATVAAAVSYDAATKTATLNPSADLASNTTYTATLTGGPTAIRDAVGNPLTSTSWTFTTGP